MQVDMYKQHFKTHMDGYCPECEVHFDNVRMLIDHCQITHRKWSCRLCGVIFSSASALKAHRSSHRFESPEARNEDDNTDDSGNEDGPQIEISVLQKGAEADEEEEEQVGEGHIPDRTHTLSQYLTQTSSASSTQTQSRASAVGAGTGNEQRVQNSDALWDSMVNKSPSNCGIKIKQEPVEGTSSGSRRSKNQISKVDLTMNDSEDEDDFSLS